MSLGRREHRWPEDADPPEPYPVECLDCGFRLPSGDKPRPLCPGPPEERGGGLDRSSRLERSSRLPPVSDRRDEKRKARGVRGPLCDWVRGSSCCVPSCGTPGADPAHVRSVNAGHGDFVRRDGAWDGNVVPLCRRHHRQFDGSVGGGSGERFERRVDVDLQNLARSLGLDWMRRHRVDPGSELHPYEQAS